MRPAGEVRQALLKAARELRTDHKGPTLRELAQHSQVGLLAARQTVSHMCRAGVLQIARPRKVAYRNRPVAEYDLPLLRADDAATRCQPLMDLIRSWSTSPAA
jgi:DNA-binding transcriptional regulator YhcF (GntR family)